MVTGKINFLFYFRMLSVFMKFLLAPKKVEEKICIHRDCLTSDVSSMYPSSTLFTTSSDAIMISSWTAVKQS